MALTQAQRATKFHGKFIYLYTHIQTKRVIYSLTRTINEVQALKQLTFVGKKTVPTEMRKDLWRPFATVCFPSEHQGLAAYRQLREFRKMHEYCYDRADIKPRKDQNGETIPHKKVKIKFLQDQMANSVADLAAVLAIQEKEGSRLDELNEQKKETARKYIAEQNEKRANLAAQADTGVLDSYTRILEKIQGKLAEMQDEHKKTVARGQIRAFRRKIQAIQTAKKEIEREAELGQHVNVTASTIGEMVSEKFGGTLPKVGYRRAILKQHEYVPTTLEGVVVKWADLTDAEYAESWPSAVRHDIIGYTNAGRRAPHAKAPARSFDGRIIRGEREGGSFGTNEVESESVEQAEPEPKSGSVFPKVWWRKNTGASQLSERDERRYEDRIS